MFRIGPWSMRRGAKGTEVTVSRLGGKSGECCVAEAKGIKKEWATMSNVVGLFNIEVTGDLEKTSPSGMVETNLVGVR